MTKYNPKSNKKYQHSVKGLYTRYKADSKRKKRRFDLTFEQLEEIIKQPCHYCGEFTKDEKFNRNRSKG
jgi:hypothetical protein